MISFTQACQVNKSIRNWVIISLSQACRANTTLCWASYHFITQAFQSFNFFTSYHFIHKSLIQILMASRLCSEIFLFKSGYARNKCGSETLIRYDTHFIVVEKKYKDHFPFSVENPFVQPCPGHAVALPRLHEPAARPGGGPSAGGRGGGWPYSTWTPGRLSSGGQADQWGQCKYVNVYEYGTLYLLFSI